MTFFKKIQIYNAPVREQVKLLLVNTLHHFSEREFIPLAAAAAASFAVGDFKKRKQEKKRHRELMLQRYRESAHHPACRQLDT